MQLQMNLILAMARFYFSRTPKNTAALRKALKEVAPKRQRKSKVAP